MGEAGLASRTNILNFDITNGDPMGDNFNNTDGDPTSDANIQYIKHNSVCLSLTPPKLPGALTSNLAGLITSSG